jgi:hypothetical protein
MNNISKGVPSLGFHSGLSKTQPKIEIKRDPNTPDFLSK